MTEERGNEVAFPNMAYSRALASFEDSQAHDNSGEALLDQEGEVDPSLAMLTDAVLLYPLVVTRLMAKCAPSQNSEMVMHVCVCVWVGV